MRAALALGAALLWQLGSLEAPGPTAELQHLRYMRTVQLPANATGPACAVLDATVFAHTASRSRNDLRLFVAEASSPAAEVPFALSESESQPVDGESAAARNVSLQGGDLVLDLDMPHRAYTDVTLLLEAKDFVAGAKVSGVDAHGKLIPLGTYTLFDLSRKHLPRSTTLTLQESSFTTLHVVLHIKSIEGGAFPGPSANIVRGAAVPPSREAQTLYTNVADATSIAQQGQDTVASLQVPAHVPVERVSFELDPKFTKDFLRPVAIEARPEGDADDIATENLAGEISSVHSPHLADAEAVANHEPVRKIAVDAILGASLGSAATIDVRIDNRSEPPLPLRAVHLQMRQRSICFEASPGSAYTLRYGDADLHAPVYEVSDESRSTASKPLMAVLGPEEINPVYAARNDARPYSERHPEVLWIGLLAVVAAAGAKAMQSMRRQRGHH